MSAPAPLIEARALAIGYAGAVIARDIDVTLRAGEVVCLLGPNGSGKTTLFKTLLGLIARLAGSVAIAGRAVERWRRRELAQQLAYVPQAHVAAFPYRVLDMVLMGRTAHLGLFSAPERGRQGDCASGAPAAWPGGSGGPRVHARERRPAPARADRQGAGPGCAGRRAGRADRQPRLR